MAAPEVSPTPEDARFAGRGDRLRTAVDEAEVMGWCEGVEMVVFEGPDEYLYGEESALLETIDTPAGPALVNNTERTVALLGPLGGLGHPAIG